MCGICGYVDLSEKRPAVEEQLLRMADTIAHRGPDSSGYFVKESVGFGFRRLSLIDLEGGNQPLYNEDRSIVLICNGEIYNYRELKADLLSKGHVFRTRSDVEVLPHLYEEEGCGFLNRLNGQFAFALYDEHERQLVLARDHFGINPLFYTLADGFFIFASEIKALLAHPKVGREVDLTGLDQILTFPGLISPRTMFKGINSLPSGHYLLIRDGDVQERTYWDLNYPRLGEVSDGEDEEYYAVRLAELLTQSVKYRMHADVPVGFYLSGGLDSALIAALVKRIAPAEEKYSFSIGFKDAELCESKYQGIMARQVGSIHHQTDFDWPEIVERLPRVIYHSESPLKETYNTASLALSEATRARGITAILTGEGADELFAGYVGYRFDQIRNRTEKAYDVDTILEDQLRFRLWQNPDLLYEKNYYSYEETKRALYSTELGAAFGEFNCLNFDVINKDMVVGRHYLHQRSYLDFKLRMADHLLGDHGDRMALANSVEARYPYLDINLVEFVRSIPPELKLNDFVEKYILRKMAEGFVPREILSREKYAFLAPGSSYLLKQKIAWIDDLLSYERIKREGYFNPATVESLKNLYREPGFKLDLPFESDLLIIVITFGMFLELFDLPHLN